MSLEEVPKIQNADFIGQAITQAQTYKASHRLNLIQRVFQRRITKILKKLQVMNTENSGQGGGLAALTVFR